MSKIYMIITFMVLPFYWIRSQFLRRFGSQKKINKEMQMYPRHYLGFRNIKVKSVGKQVDKEIPAVYLCNHQSQNDIFITISAINRPFRFIAKKELFTSFITGTFMKMSKSYPLDREDALASFALLKKAVNDVNNGESILVFPEGTRSHRKDLLPFKDGLFTVLRKVDAPIIPMYIKESYNEKQKEVKVYFGEAIYPKNFNKLRGIELSKLIFDKMNQLKELAYS